MYPILDGVVLRQTLDAAFTSGAFNQVPIIAGTNHDEGRIFVALFYDFTGHPLTDAEYEGALMTLYGNTLGSLVFAEYPLINYPAPRAPLALGTTITDVDFACTSRNAYRLLSTYVPIYTYEFNDESVPSFPSYLPPVSFPLGATHATELQYLFNLRALGITPTFTSGQQQLSDTIVGYWTQFAKRGNPNSEGAAIWSPYTAATAEFQSLAAPTGHESDALFDADHKCSSFWNTF
jgi:para-nitrobenzyl esterase